MPFIDWSDPEEMFGLLIEYIADEKSESSSDPQREQFLSDLLEDLKEIDKQFTLLSRTEIIHQLRKIHASFDPEFKKDPVVLHVRDCIEELERLNH